MDVSTHATGNGWPEADLLLFVPNLDLFSNTRFRVQTVWNVIQIQIGPVALRRARARAAAS